MSVKLKNFGKRYGNREVLSGLDLDIPAGSMYGLVGPNGAGKTTLFRILVGLTPVTSGRAEVLGTRPGATAVRRSTGYMTQAEASRCHKLGLIREGRLIAEGSPGELLEQAGARTVEEAFLAFARTEFQVFQFIPVVIIPQLLLCGIVWPLSTMPDWLRVLAYCMPVTYAVEAIRDVAVRGMGVGEVWWALAALLGFAVLGAGLAALSVRRSV